MLLIIIQLKFFKNWLWINIIIYSNLFSKWKMNSIIQFWNETEVWINNWTAVVTGLRWWRCSGRRIRNRWTVHWRGPKPNTSDWPALEWAGGRGSGGVDGHRTRRPLRPFRRAARRRLPYRRPPCPDPAPWFCPCIRLDRRRGRIRPAGCRCPTWNGRLPLNGPNIPSRLRDLQKIKWFHFLVILIIILFHFLVL